jgi:hypothetical protein
VAVFARFPLALLVASALLIAGCGSNNDSSGATSTAAIKGGSTRDIVGQWAGTLTQPGLPPFRAAALIFSGAGKVAYTGIDCAGDWKLDSGGDASGSYVFAETINEGAGGACKGTGTVHLDQFAPKRLRYRFEGGGVSSQGTLRPARTPVWAAIFREAGVEVGTSSGGDCPKGALTCGASVAGTAPAGTTTITGGMSK